MPTCANMCHYAPRWANIAVCSCAEKDSLFVPMAQAPPKASAKESLYSLNLIRVYITKVIYAGLPKERFPTEACLCGHECFSVVAQATAKICPRPAKGYFQRKEFDRTTEAIVQMNEMWRKLNANMRQYVSLRAKMGQHCSLQLCRERQPFRSHGTSSSQGRRKRIVV